MLLAGWGKEGMEIPEGKENADRNKTGRNTADVGAERQCDRTGIKRCLWGIGIHDSQRLECTP
jgi:hypothetical protein